MVKRDSIGWLASVLTMAEAVENSFLPGEIGLVAGVAVGPDLEGDAEGGAAALRGSKERTVVADDEGTEAWPGAVRSAGEAVDRIECPGRAVGRKFVDGAVAAASAQAGGSEDIAGRVERRPTVRSGAVAALGGEVVDDLVGLGPGRLSRMARRKSASMRTKRALGSRCMKARCTKERRVA